MTDSPKPLTDSNWCPLGPGCPGFVPLSNKRLRALAHSITGNGGHCIYISKDDWFGLLATIADRDAQIAALKAEYVEVTREELARAICKNRGDRFGDTTPWDSLLEVTRAAYLSDADALLTTPLYRRV